MRRQTTDKVEKIVEASLRGDEVRQLRIEDGSISSCTHRIKQNNSASGQNRSSRKPRHGRILRVLPFHDRHWSPLSLIGSSFWRIVERGSRYQKREEPVRIVVSDEKREA